MSSPNDSSQRWNFLNKESQNLQEYWKKMEHTEERLAHLPGSAFVPATRKSNRKYTTGSVLIKLVLFMILVASVFFIGYRLLQNGMGNLTFDY